MFRIFALLALALFASPAVAQQGPVAGGNEEEGLSVTVTDDSAWQDIGIAIASFATNRDVPTPANNQGTGALGLELARIVYNDLRFNGLFRPVGPDSLPRPTYPQITAPGMRATPKCSFTAMSRPPVMGG
jgi:TolB protein